MWLINTIHKCSDHFDNNVAASEDLRCLVSRFVHAASVQPRLAEKLKKGLQELNVCWESVLECPAETMGCHHVFPRNHDSVTYRDQKNF